MPITHTFFSLILSLSAAVAAVNSFPSPPTNTQLPSDAVSLFTFKSKADLDNKLFFELNERFDYCQWRGVKCAQGRVVRLFFQSFGLRGFFAPNTLTRLDQLRVLSLKNNSLAGPIPDLSLLVNLKSLFLDHNSFSGAFPPPIPDLSLLVNLKSLFLDHNSFSGAFPPSIPTLHRLLTLDLSYNNFSGPIPVEVNNLNRLYSLRLEWNHFNGSLPPLNQSFLLVLNVSGNNLTGLIPATAALSRFRPSSFLWNSGLCGEILNKACSSPTPFFDSANATAPAAQPLIQSASQGVVLSPPSSKNHRKTGLILGVSIGVAIVVAAILCLFAVVRTNSSQNGAAKPTVAAASSSPDAFDSHPAASTVETHAREFSELPAKTKTIEEVQRVHGSGNLVFCSGEAKRYSLEQLMRASAELLGRGTIGTTYKAVLDNQLIVTVKRLDAGKTAVTGSEAFELHLEAVGGLRHPNLVPLRAFFQAKGERLLIYDYQPNGSLFNLIHGSRSTRAKPLHWTSCLKIAEDVAQGLAYIHQASRLIHGNLKSTNVLLGTDFEACLADYSLAILADSSANDDPDSAGYKAPEIRKSSRRATAKSDVYAFGMLLLELLTGKHPSQHPFLLPTDVQDWVRAMREDDSGEGGQLGMLTEVASICSVTSPEQRPAMWQVLKMVQEIKESVMTDQNAYVGYS